MATIIRKSIEGEFTFRELEIMRRVFMEYDFQELIIADSNISADEIDFLLDKIEEKITDVLWQED